MTELTELNKPQCPLMNTYIMHLLLMSKQEYLLSRDESYESSLLKNVFLIMHMRKRIKTKGATVEQVWELSGCRLQRSKKFEVGLQNFKTK